MFLPIGDENPREKTPYVTWGLIAINVAVFLLNFPEPSRTVLTHYGLIPANPRPEDFLTSMFMHAGFMHLIGNMLFLWIFGDNVEDRLGHVPFLVFYLAAGAAADVLHIASDLRSEIPTIGASGAISGVVGAYVVMFPKHNIKMLLWIWIYVDILRIQAVWWAGVWFAMQLLYSFLDKDGGVAYFAHIGGFVAGLGVAGVWKYMLFPRAFGLHGADERVPGDLLAASRQRGRSTSVRRPLVTVDTSGIEFVDERHSQYAVLRMSDCLEYVRSIATVVERHAGVPARRTAERLYASRGVIARGIPRAPAEHIEQTLRRAGIDTLIVPDDRSAWPPVPLAATAVAWNEREIEWTQGGERSRVPWSTPFLFLGAAVGGRPFVDIFVKPGLTLRASTDLRALASDALRLRSGAVLNEGVGVLAAGGRWGWLAFREASDYDDYAFWACNVVLSRLPVRRF